MATRSVCTLTNAPAGTGKSYRRCAHFIVTEVLDDTDLVHLSNFPIQLDPWDPDPETGEMRKRGLIAVAKARGVRCSEDEIRRRIQFIAKSELDKWRDEESGPWETFADVDLSGTHIAIDEIHNYCGDKTSPKIRKEWQKWLGEIRHRGARIEFITQHPMKMAKELRQECETKLELVSGASGVDPFFRIPMQHWYNVRAFFTRKYTPCVFENEYRQSGSRWKHVNGIRFWFEADLFECYDSFSAPVQGGAGGKLAKEPWERLNPLSFWVWFLSSNFFQIGTRATLVGVMVWLSAFGGGKVVMGKLFEHIKNGMTTRPVVGVSAETKAASAEAAANQLQNAARRTNATDLQKILSQNPGSFAVDMDGEKQPADEKSLLAREQRIAELAAQWVLAGMTDDAVAFGNGQVFQVGEKITEGPYDGILVLGTFLRKRYADIGGARVVVGDLLSDRLRQWATSQADSGRAVVQRFVPPRDDEKQPAGGRGEAP